MVVQRYPELLGPPADVVTVHAAGERLVLQLLLDGRDLEVGEALRGTDQRTRDQEPAELVDRKECLREGGLPGHTRIIGVPQNGLTHWLPDATLAEQAHPPARMLLGGRVCVVRITLVVEVVE